MLALWPTVVGTSRFEGLFQSTAVGSSEQIERCPACQDLTRVPQHSLPERQRHSPKLCGNNESAFPTEWKIEPLWGRAPRLIGVSLGKGTMDPQGFGASAANEFLSWLGRTTGIDPALLPASIDPMDIDGLAAELMTDAGSGMALEQVPITMHRTLRLQSSWRIPVA